MRLFQPVALAATVASVAMSTMPTSFLETDYQSSHGDTRTADRRPCKDAHSTYNTACESDTVAAEDNASTYSADPSLYLASQGIHHLNPGSSAAEITTEQRSFPRAGLPFGKFPDLTFTNDNVSQNRDRPSEFNQDR